MTEFTERRRPPRDLEALLRSEREDHAATKERLKELSLNVLAWWKIIFDVPFVDAAQWIERGGGPLDLAAAAKKEIDRRTSEQPLSAPCIGLITEANNMIDETRLQKFYDRIHSAVGVRIEQGDKSDNFFRNLIEQGLKPAFTPLGAKRSIAY